MPAVVSIAAGRKRGSSAQEERPGEYVIMQLALPGARPRNIGVLLLDAAEDHMEARLLDHWDEVENEDDRELLQELQADLDLKIGEMGGQRFLRSLEDCLSNTLRISDRAPVQIAGFSPTLDRLFGEHVEEPKVLPFRTHLPLYTLRAAATKFGEDMEVEPEGWVPTPKSLRLNERMFVAQVVGRSMEPMIPDGSYCVFRYGVVGSRQNRIVVVERHGVSDTGARYSVKRYTSSKRQRGQDEWEHASVVMEPVNREFESFPLREQDRIIAEFVQVLD